MTTIPLILYISRKWDEEWMRGRGGGSASILPASVIYNNEAV